MTRKVAPQGEPQTESSREADPSKLENFTIPEFCAWQRVSRATVYRAIKDGKLIAHKFRGRTIIRRADAEKHFTGS